MNGSYVNNYAEALFVLSCEQDCLEQTFGELGVLAEVFRLNPDLVKFFNLPTVEWQEKEQVIKDTLKDRLSVLTYNFLSVVALKGRSGGFCEIYSAFKELYNKKMNILEVTVSTSEPLSERLREKLTQKLCLVSGKTIKLNEKTDKSILGGIVLSYNNTVLSGSIKDRLDKLKAQIDSIVV